MNIPSLVYIMTKLTCIIACFAALPLVGFAASPSDKKLPAKLKVLIIDGQNNHKWKTTTPVLKHALEEGGDFEVTVSTSPPKGTKPEGWKNWNPKFSDYAAVVSNYNGDMWPEAVQKSFVAYVTNGGGFVCVHAADNSFGKWEEYNKMIAVGGWGGRKLVRDGAWLHVVDGKVVRDTTTEGGAGSHGPRHEFVVNHLESDHPIIKGLPNKWLHTKDELYCKLCGPAEHVEVLGSAKSKKSKREEPMLMVIKYGKGRVFHTTLGHDAEAMRCRGFYELLQRGTEWSISGEVVRTAEVPKDFPTEHKTSPVAPAE